MRGSGPFGQLDSFEAVARQVWAKFFFDHPVGAIRGLHAEQVDFVVWRLCYDFAAKVQGVASDSTMPASGLTGVNVEQKFHRPS